jgi:hypothetical protein
MRPPPSVNVSAILTAVYRPAPGRLDHLASRVQARMALLETLGECLRLVLEAPASALTATLGEAEEPAEAGKKD